MSAPVDCESIAAEILSVVDGRVPGMRAVARAHVEGGILIAGDGPGQVPNLGQTASCFRWPTRGGWVGVVDPDLDAVGLRRALAWVVATVSLSKRRLAFRHEDEHRLARALLMPREPFLRDVVTCASVADLAHGYDVTEEDVRLRLADLGGEQG